MPDAAPAFVWAEELAAPGGQVTLGEEESHHVARVCRARAGETLVLSDGCGGLARGLVESLTPRVVVRVERVEQALPTREAVLLCGAAEGRRFDWVVEKLAEMGVRRVRPVDCERERWEEQAVRPDRWRRLARAALQQSRGRFLLAVEPPVSLEEAIEAEAGAAMSLVADPAGKPAGGLEPPGIGRTVGVVGPSSGLSGSEVAFLTAQGAGLISLSNSRLRTETAAISWAAWWAAPRDPQE